MFKDTLERVLDENIQTVAEVGPEAGGGQNALLSSLYYLAEESTPLSSPLAICLDLLGLIEGATLTRRTRETLRGGPTALSNRYGGFATKIKDPLDLAARVSVKYSRKGEGFRCSSAVSCAVRASIVSIDLGVEGILELHIVGGIGNNARVTSIDRSVRSLFSPPHTARQHAVFSRREYYVTVSSERHVQLLKPVLDFGRRDPNRLMVFDFNLGRMFGRRGRDSRALEGLRTLLAPLVELSSIEELLSFLLLLGGLPAALLDTCVHFFGETLPDRDEQMYEEIGPANMLVPYFVCATRSPVVARILDDQFSSIFSEIKEDPLLLHTFRVCIVDCLLRASHARLARFDRSVKYAKGDWEESKRARKVPQAERSIQQQLQLLFDSFPVESDAAWAAFEKLSKHCEIIHAEFVTVQVEEYGHQRRETVRATIRLPNGDFQFHMEWSYGIWSFERRVLLGRLAPRSTAYIPSDGIWHPIPVAKSVEDDETTRSDAVDDEVPDPLHLQFLRKMELGFQVPLDVLAEVLSIIGRSASLDG